MAVFRHSLLNLCILYHGVARSVYTIQCRQVSRGVSNKTSLCLNVAMIDPIEEIVAERERARSMGDPNVDICFLATVTVDDHPAVRAITLRDIGPGGFDIIITSAGLKWQQIQRPEGYELLILWPRVRRQYRISGEIAPLPEKELEKYWQRKKLGSRLLELYYPTFEHQSASIPSREHLMKGIETLKQKYPRPDDVPRPKDLKGIRLVPKRIDVWHGSEDRLHDRMLYTLGDNGWEERVLVP